MCLELKKICIYIAHCQADIQLANVYTLTINTRQRGSGVLFVSITDSVTQNPYGPFLSRQSCHWAVHEIHWMRHVQWQSEHLVCEDNKAHVILSCVASASQDVESDLLIVLMSVWGCSLLLNSWLVLHLYQPLWPFRSFFKQIMVPGY